MANKIIDVKAEFPSAEPKAIIYLNPFTYNYFRKNIKQIENVSAFRIDGTFMTMVLRTLGLNVPERQSFDMTSLAPFVFARCVEMNLRLYVCGGKTSEVVAFVNTIKMLYPNLDVCGFCDGYFSDVGSQKVVDKIVLANPDVVLLGLGGIRQERFASILFPKVNAFVFTCGAFISQTALKADYYPPFIKRFGFRWLYRFYKEPRVIKRVLVHYPLFLMNVTFDFLRAH